MSRTKIRNRIILTIIALFAWLLLGCYCMTHREGWWLAGSIIGFSMTLVTTLTLAMLFYTDVKIRAALNIYPEVKNSVLELADWYATREDQRQHPGITELQAKLQDETTQYRTSKEIGPGLIINTLSAMDQLTGEKHTLVLQVYLDELMQHPQDMRFIREAYRSKQQEISQPA